MRTKAKTIPHELNERIFTKSSVLGLAMAWVVVSVLQWIWLVCDHHPPHGDGIVFILRGMDLANLARAEGIGALVKAIIFYSGGVFLSLVDIAYTVYYLIFGVASEMELMTNVVFLGIGMIGVYGMGAYLFDRMAGFIATALFVSSPGLILFEKLGFREFHLMCFLALTCFFLLKAEKFTNRKYSLLCGLSLGLTFTIKFDTIIYVFIPFLFTIFGWLFSLKKGDISRSRSVINALLFFGITALIFVGWYMIPSNQLMPVLINRFSDPGGQSLSPRMLPHNYFPYIVFFKEEIACSVFVFLVFVLVYCFCTFKQITLRLRQVGNLLYLLLCCCMPLTILSFLSVKNQSHSLPALVFLSVLVAGAFYFVKSRIARFIFIVFLSLHFVVIHSGTMRVNSIENNDTTSFLMKISLLDRTSEWLQNNKFTWRLFSARNVLLDKPAWNVFMKDILRDIDNDHTARKLHGKVAGDAVILPLLNNMPLRCFQFQYYTQVLGLSFIIRQLLYEKVFWDESMSTQILYEDRIDYILFEDPYIFPEELGEEYGLSRMLYHIETHRDRFDAHYELFRTMDTPRDSKLMIYRKISG